MANVTVVLAEQKRLKMPLFSDEVWPISWPKWYKPSNARKTANRYVRHGLHPSGRPLGVEASRCGNCRHFNRVRYHAKTYFKCDLGEWTHGKASDLCKKWRGCELFEAQV